MNRKLSTFALDSYCCCHKMSLTFKCQNYLYGYAILTRFTLFLIILVFLFPLFCFSFFWFYCGFMSKCCMIPLTPYASQCVVKHTTFFLAYTSCFLSSYFSIFPPNASPAFFSIFTSFVSYMNTVSCGLSQMAAVITFSYFIIALILHHFLNFFALFI